MDKDGTATTLLIMKRAPKMPTTMARNFEDLDNDEMTHWTRKTPTYRPISVRRGWLVINDCIWPSLTQFVAARS